MTSDFDLRALRAALDAQRQARALSWAELGRLLGISASTLRSLSERPVAEGDGVLRMSVWLERHLESFVAGGRTAGTDALPPAAAARELRFDARAIYGALDARRVEHGMTWAQVAEATGAGSASAFTRLRDGGRIMFPGAMRIFGWLGEPAVRFIRRVPR